MWKQLRYILRAVLSFFGPPCIYIYELYDHIYSGM